MQLEVIDDERARSFDVEELRNISLLTPLAIVYPTRPTDALVIPTDASPRRRAVNKAAVTARRAA